MGYRLKACFIGYVTEVDEENKEFYCRLTDLQTREEYNASIPIKNVIPQTEQKYIKLGAYFSLRVRRRVTIKFFKKTWSRKAWRRRLKNVRKEWGPILEKFEA